MTTPFASSSNTAELEPSISQDIRLIPAWSLALGALAFLLMQYVYWVVLPHSHPDRPTTIPFAVRIYFSLSLSAMAAFYMLMIGYVSKDAPRREMSTRLWIVICLMPGGVGSVLYFLLRQPMVTLCPSCSTRVHTQFHFCPQCAYQLSAACGNCYRDVRMTDLFCVHCGHNLTTDDTPSRLRAFHS